MIQRSDGSKKGKNMAKAIPSKSSVKKLHYLPEEVVLPSSGESVVFDYYQDTDFDVVFNMLKESIDEGQTYPQATMDKKHFRSYYLSYDAFVVRHDDIPVGSFYIKPNFPDRSSHLCNAAFLVNKNFRGKGLGQLLTIQFLRLARDLGYKAAFFNLVYESNKAAIHIYRKLGFVEIGRIPRAGNLNELGYTDAFQFYYDLES